MQWTCESSGATFSYPIDEVVGKQYCTGCGKTHHLTPGKLSDFDREMLKKIAAAAKEDYGIIEDVEGAALIRSRETIKYSKEYGEHIRQDVTGSRGRRGHY